MYVAATGTVCMYNIRIVQTWIRYFCRFLFVYKTDKKFSKIFKSTEKLSVFQELSRALEKNSKFQEFSRNSRISDHYFINRSFALMLLVPMVVVFNTGTNLVEAWKWYEGFKQVYKHVSKLKFIPVVGLDWKCLSITRCTGLLKLAKELFVSNLVVCTNTTPAE